jgi:hypothetical protein
MFFLIIKNLSQKYISSFFIIISCYTIRCNAQDNVETVKRDVKIISGVIFAAVIVSLFFIWIHKNHQNQLRGKIDYLFSYIKFLCFSNNKQFFILSSCVKILYKVHNREMYDATNSIHTDSSTARLESITSSCRSSFSFRTSFNSIILSNMVRPTRPTITTSQTQGSSTRRTTAATENLLIELDGQNRRSFAFITIPSPTRRNQNQNQYRNDRNDPIYHESYLNELDQDILETEPPPIYKP